MGGAIYYTKAELSGASDQAGQSMQHFHLNDTKSTGTPVFGVGAEYKIDKDMTLRLEYENFSKPNVAFNTKMKQVDMISIGLRSSFN